MGKKSKDKKHDAPSVAVPAAEHAPDEHKAAKAAAKAAKADKKAAKAAAKAEKAAAKAAAKAAKAETAAADAAPPAEKPAAEKAPKAKKEKTPSIVERRLASLAPEAADTAPHLPVSHALHEADRVWREAKNQRDSFRKVPGFDIDDLDHLRAFVAALDEAESSWRKVRLDKRDAAHAAERREAEDLRATAIASGRYLLRHDPRAQAELDFIAEGEGIADLIQDLRDLTKFVNAHGDAFATDLNLPEGATARMTALAEILMAGSDTDEARAALASRNRAFHVLQHAVGEVRAAARYLFRGKPKRLDAFTSSYHGNSNGKRPAPRNKPASSSPPAAAPAPRS